MEGNVENIYYLEKAKKSCIKLLKYRIKYQIRVVKDPEKEVYCLVLREKGEYNQNVTSSVAILYRSDDYQEVKDKLAIYLEAISGRISEDLVLVQLDKGKDGNVYYVLSDSGNRHKVIDATSSSELESNGKILYISKGRDPPEVVSSEIIYGCFGNVMTTCSSSDKRCIEMVRNGDTQKLKEESQVASSVKCARDEMYWTTLHHAANCGNLEMLSFLISMGCDVQRDICGRYPMHIAAREGHTDVIKKFCVGESTVPKIAFIVNQADGIGWTMLHYAAWKGSLKAVKFLLQMKASVNVKDKCYGKTPLHVATEEGHVGVVLLLLSSGSNIEEETEEGRTPIHLAAIEGHLSIVELLVNARAYLNAVDHFGWTPLHHAAYKEHLNVVGCLVDEGANLNVVDEEDCTPLHYAAYEDRLHTIEYLVLKGANLNAVDREGSTPLHYAALKGHLNTVKYLVDKGGNLNAADENGKTPLHCATVRKRWNVVELLVDMGANPNTVDEDDCTPLHCAAYEANLNTIEYLLDKGDKLNAIKDGSAPLHCAALKEHCVADKEHCAADKEHCAAVKEHWNVVDYLVDKGADINAANKYGFTPLHLAVIEGNLQVVKFLVKKGANMRAVDRDGFTPLHLAAGKE